MAETSKIVFRIGIGLMWLGILLNAFRVGGRTEDIKEVKQFAKSENIQLLQPQMRVNLLRYIENDDKDSMVYMQKKITAMKEEQKILDTVKIQLQDLQKLVDKKKYGEAIDVVINIKAELKKKKFEVLDSKPLIADLEQKRVELYSKAGR